LVHRKGEKTCKGLTVERPQGPPNNNKKKKTANTEKKRRTQRTGPASAIEKAPEPGDRGRVGEKSGGTGKGDGSPHRIHVLVD